MRKDAKEKARIMRHETPAGSKAIDWSAEAERQLRQNIKLQKLLKERDVESERLRELLRRWVDMRPLPETTILMIDSRDALKRMEMDMTEKQARELAKREHYYSATKIRGQWVVWDARADHIVEFDKVEQ